MSKKNSWPLEFKVGLFITSVLLFISIISIFIPESWFQIQLEKSYETPSLLHPFGLDENGVDVFIQAATGSRISFLVAFSVVLISLFIGLIIGTVSAYFDKHLDVFLMRVVDMVYAFPNFLIAMALMAILGPSVLNLILVMSISSWATYARLIRGEVLYLKKKEFVLSVESLGASAFRKVLKHIWPNLIPVLSIQVTLSLSGIILAESGLSFLGIGVPPDTPTLGSLLQIGRQSLIEAPHLSLFPGLCLFFLILGFYLMGEGLKKHLSPHL